MAKPISNNSRSHVTPSPLRPIRGAKTTSDKAPMSTPKYKSHIRKYAASK